MDEYKSSAKRSILSPLQWQISKNLILYPEAVEFMEQHVRKIRDQNSSELVWLLEHPSLYTAGTSANLKDILNPHLCPLYKTGRGGQITYHGPGQRIAYLMLDLQKRNLDIHSFVRLLEQWLMHTLADFKISTICHKNRIGLWVVDSQTGHESKIAAIGIRVRKWVTFHGIALNIHPDLSYYQGIVPCGLQGYGVTSMHQLGVQVSMAEVDNALEKHFERVFKISTLN